MQVQDVDLRLLRVFVAIVECGGLSAAETRLNIGRSTISSHLADLEGRLNMQLCRRGRAGFQITEQGRIIYEASIALFQQCESFVASVADAKSGLSGTLSISTIDMLISDRRFRLSEAISRIKSKDGNFQINIHVRSPENVELSVLNGEYSVGIGIRRYPLRGLHYELLYTEDIYLYCGSENPLFECDSGQIPKLLESAELVGHGYTRDLEFHGAKPPCKTTATTVHDEGVTHLILSGQFVGYLPEHFAETWVTQGFMKAVDPDRYFFSNQIVLITNKTKKQSNLVRTFVDEIKLLHQSDR